MNRFEDRGHSICCPRTVPTCIVASRLLDTVGHSALIPIESASRETGCRIFAKAEFLNPGGSVKDRIAKFIIDQAERRGELRQGSTILEVTSGNTGISFAMLGAMRGYRVVIVMPRTVSRERRQMIEAFGANVRLIDRLTGIGAAIKESQVEAEQDSTIFLPRQFSNSDNALCHEFTTGREISSQVEDNIDAFVAGVGTGGTLMGVARALKRTSHYRSRIIAVEATESPVMSGGEPGEHGIQGLADGFLPELVCLDEIDEIVTVRTGEALARSHRLAREDGLLVGVSAGANVAAAEAVAKRMGPGRTVVTVLPDRGERYLSVGD